MKLSIVTSVYKTGKYLMQFELGCVDMAHRNNIDAIEIIYVLDGIENDYLHAKNLPEDVTWTRKVVVLSRNFGQQRALMEGLLHVNGDFVFMIDSDMEEDPRWFGLFLETLLRCQADCVYGVQKFRKGPLFERISGRIFYWIVKYTMNNKIEGNLCTARLMSRRFYEKLLQFQEKEIFMAGLTSLVGFEQQFVFVDKKYREGGSYSLWMKVELAARCILNHSTKPLWTIIITGLVLLCLGAMYVALQIAQWLIGGAQVVGWGSVVASIWMVGGIQLVVIGIVGLYIGIIFEEIKNRPRTIVKESWQVSP